MRGLCLQGEYIYRHRATLDRPCAVPCRCVRFSKKSRYLLGPAVRADLFPLVCGPFSDPVFVSPFDKEEGLVCEGPAN